MRHFRQTALILLIILLFISLSPVNATGTVYSRFVLYDLTGGKRVKQNSTYRTLNACMTAGRQFQSMECSVIWIQIRPEPKPEPKQDETSHVANTCNQEGK